MYPVSSHVGCGRETEASATCGFSDGFMQGALWPRQPTVSTITLVVNAMKKTHVKSLCFLCWTMAALAGKAVNSLAPRRYGYDFTCMDYKYNIAVDILSIQVNNMVSQYCFRKWLGAFRHSIIGAMLTTIYVVICCHNGFSISPGT